MLKYFLGGWLIGFAVAVLAPYAMGEFDFNHAIATGRPYFAWRVQYGVNGRPVMASGFGYTLLLSEQINARGCRLQPQLHFDHSFGFMFDRARVINASECGVLRP